MVARSGYLPSGIAVKGGLWEVHHDPYDLSHVWVRDARAGGWITVPWTRLNEVSAPFDDFTWRHARSLLAARGADDTNETAFAAAVQQLLDRAETGSGPARHGPHRAAAARPLRPEEDQSSTLKRRQRASSRRSAA